MYHSLWCVLSRCSSRACVAVSGALKKTYIKKGFPGLVTCEITGKTFTGKGWGVVTLTCTIITTLFLLALGPAVTGSEMLDPPGPLVGRAACDPVSKSLEGREWVWHFTAGGLALTLMVFVWKFIVNSVESRRRSFRLFKLKLKTEKGCQKQMTAGLSHKMNITLGLCQKCLSECFYNNHLFL